MKIDVEMSPQDIEKIAETVVAKLQGANLTESATAETRFIPIKKWPDFHPWPSENGLRYYIFHEKRNGFDQVVVRQGNRVLIDEKRFVEWMRKQNPEV
jgi:hypothetical protein